jgi:hypothetical protein
MYLLFNKHFPQEPRNGFGNYCRSFVNVNVNSSVFNYCNNEKITLTSIPNLNWSLALPRQLKKTIKANRHHNLCLEEFYFY